MGCHAIDQTWSGREGPDGDSLETAAKGSSDVCHSFLFVIVVGVV